MADEIRIRIGETRDVGELVAFNQAMALETEAKELDLEALSAGVQNLLKHSEHGFYLVAEETSASHATLIGSLMVTYEWSDWRNGLFWWIQSVYIRPEHRRRGVYRKLYEVVKKMAATEEGVCGFRLYVEKENTTAQRTYEELGMTETHYLMFEELLDRN